jgi:uncharacterized membrane protein (DUF373 family)
VPADATIVHGGLWRRLLGWLELFQDFVLFGLVLGLYALMGWQLVSMWRHLRQGTDVRAVLTDILYVLILVELFRVIMHYLRERHVAVGTMVEIAIISVLREIILRGPLEAPWPQLLAATALLAVLGLLFRFAGFHRGAPLEAGAPPTSSERPETAPSHSSSAHRLP